MRAAFLLIPAIVAIIAAIPMLATDSDAEEPIEFTEGLFTYRLFNEACVTVIGYDNEHAEENVKFPAEVEYKGDTYVVVELSCTLSSDVIKTVTIPEYVWSVPHPGMLKEGVNIKEFIVNDKNFDLKSVDGVLYDSMERQLIAYPKANEISVYEVPSSVVIICEDAFSGCNNLLSVGMSMYGASMTEIRARAFYKCENLEYINNIGDENVLPDSLSIIDDWAFKDCYKISTFKLPDSLRVIGESAFENTAITKANIPSRVIALGTAAFGNCSRLEEITTEGNLKYFTENGVLFEMSNDVKSILAYPSAKKDREYTIDRNVSFIYEQAFEGTKHLRKVILPDSMIMIPASAFKNCRSLEEIDLSNVVLVDYDAFANCVTLSNVTFGSNLSSINPDAFANCGFTEVDMPTSITYVGPYAFSECKVLKRFTIQENTNVTLYNSMLKGCTSLEKVELLSPGITLGAGALDIAMDGQTQTVEIVKVKNYNIPENAVSDASTVLDVHILGERPYPYENYIGVVACILVLIIIIRIFRYV